MRFPIIDIPAWYEDAACADSAYPEAWFPKPEVRRPKAVETCRECVVRVACLDHALSEDIRDGIWGGMTEDERAALRRRA